MLEGFMQNTNDDGLGVFRGLVSCFILYAIMGSFIYALVLLF